MEHCTEGACFRRFSQYKYLTAIQNLFAVLAATGQARSSRARIKLVPVLGFSAPGPWSTDYRWQLHRRKSG